MIVVEREKKKQIDSFVLRLPDYFLEGDVLILNNSKRVPGILKATIKDNNAQIELFFVNLGKNNSVMCRIYPTHYIEIGTKILIDNYELIVQNEGVTTYMKLVQ